MDVHRNLENAKDEELFLNLLNGFYTVDELIRRAAKNGYFIEYVCLVTSFIDAILRIGLLYRYQLDHQKREFPRKLLYQSRTDKNKMREREMYQTARAKGIIDTLEFEELESLYSERNIVVHRYIISEVTTAEVLEIAIRYEAMIPKLNKRLIALEDTLMQTEIGMVYTSEHLTPLERMKADLNTRDGINGKHGSSFLADRLRP